jgi:hypothetical protein
MNVIPLQAIPAQTVNILLAGQNCQISVFQKGEKMYLTLIANSKLLLSSIICRNRVKIVRYPYLGFVGDLVFIDNAGNSDPLYTGLGSRFKLVYTP